MKKMPTLFKRVFDGHKIVNILNEVTEGCEWIITGEGKATEKVDGTCTYYNDDNYIEDMMQRKETGRLKRKEVNLIC